MAIATAIAMAMAIAVAIAIPPPRTPSLGGDWRTDLRGLPEIGPRSGRDWPEVGPRLAGDLHSHAALRQPRRHPHWCRRHSRDET
jgi:hypothetical protein